ncbi:MAG: hypothetical protein N3I35_15200 [Clostridia bacterium]|nr:hypothetical protein [Clostridia bacterium]
MENNVFVKEKNVQVILDEVEKRLKEFPDLKFIRLTGDDFARDAVKASQISRGMADLKNTRDFVWGCRCKPFVLADIPELAEELADCGLVRIELEINTQSDNNDFTYASVLCSKGVIPQVVGHMVLDWLPQSIENIESVLERVRGLITASPGSFEPGPSPLLRIYSASDLPFSTEDNLSSDSVILLENYESTPWKLKDIRKDWPIIVQQKYYSQIISCMCSLEAKRKIPHKKILSHFTLYENYGIDSLWHSTIFKKYKVLFNYFNLLSRGAARRSIDIAPDELETWRPQRTIDMWASVDYEKGYPRIGSQVLSPLEYELFLHSTGKLTLQQVLDVIFSRFGSRFEGYGEFYTTAMSILRSFEDRYWLAYTAI